MTASLRNREYVLAARYLGVRPRAIIVRHIIPNLASFLIVDATLNVSAAVIGETSLSYLGLGVRPPDVSLGTVIADGASSATAFPWLFVPPVIALVLIVLTVNLIGEGLRDALAPERRPHAAAPRIRPARCPSPGNRTTPLLAVSGLHVTFPGGVRVVRGADFGLSPGEVLPVVGESGAGKSATALAITGLLPTARVEGSVRLRGRELLGLGDKELAAIRGSDIAMICQDQEFTPVRRIGAQIAETVRLHHRVPRRTAAERAIELLRLADIPDARRVARAFPHELSGGLRRRAMIAMAVAGDPAVILADEPTAGLDPPVQAAVLDTLQSHQSRTGAALVLITHDLAVAARAGRVLVMYAGRPIETGPVDEVFTRPRMPYTAALLNSIPRLDRPDGPRPVSRVAGWRRPATSAPAVSGSPRGSRPARLPLTGSPPSVVLEVDGLAKRYPLHKPFRRRTGELRAVDGVSFDIRAGETLGLVGESGCGKTTVLMEVLRLGVAQGGRIVVFGRDTATLSAAERRLLRVTCRSSSRTLSPRSIPADGQGHPRRATASPPQARRRRPDRRAAAPHRAGARARLPLSRRALRRSAAARRHRPRSGARTQAPPHARTLLRARRLRPGGHHRPAPRAEDRSRPGVPARGARPRGGTAARRPRRRHASRADRGDRRRRRHL
jgi:peptide/nickel transport system ATP-binding protein